MFILKRKNKICLLFLFFVSSYNLFSKDIRTLYPKEYKNALSLKPQYEALFKERGFENSDFYIAIVFPEMIRYNEIQDELESLLNKVAYTTIDTYSGCSISPFQIKPACALEIEEIVKSNKELKKKYPLICDLDSSNSFSTKLKRINRLQQKKYQIEYLLAFVDICETKYNLSKESEIEKLRVTSAAYNIGLLENVDDFDNFLSINCFPHGSKSPDSYWNYTELVLDFYDQFSNE